MNLVGLVQGHVPIERVTLDAVDLSIWPLADGRTSIQTLFRDGPLPADMPFIDIRRGLVRIAHAESASEQEMICHDLTVSVRPKRITVPHEKEAVTLVAQLSSSHFTKLHMVLDLAKDKSRWAMRGSRRAFLFIAMDR